MPRIDPRKQLSIIIASTFPRDERLGSSKVPLRIGAELDAAGAAVTMVFGDDLPRVPAGRVALLASPYQMAVAMRAKAAQADVVDIAGWDGYVYARWARRARPHQLVVARSNGLWVRSIPFKGIEGRSAARQLAARFMQAELCRRERASIVAGGLALFNTRGEADWVVGQGWKSPEEIAVINPGIDDVFASTVPLEQRAGAFYIGSFLHQKGGDVAVDAMRLVLAERPAATMTFVGPGVEPRTILERFPDALRPRVRVIEKIPAARVAAEVSAGAVLLFPALYEGFGMVVLEAMRAGLVVVATPTGAGAEIVRDGVNGLAVPFSDPRLTADAVLRLLDDGPLRVRLARAAVEEARHRTWKATAASLMQAYRDARIRLDVARR
ncbi:MAG TPA: glycosyltransferase family 4 protein [Polyangia bacterium]|nr:glycosyltransferase family 4 protein [Polyangia bacterium]